MPRTEAPPYVTAVPPVRIAELRAEIRRHDAEILGAIARRIQLCHAIGRLKLAAGVPIRDRAVEERVVFNARAIARRHDLEPGFAERVLREIIEHSVACQRRLVHEPESPWPHT